MQTWWIKLGDIFHWIPELREALEEIDMELLKVEDYSDTDYEPHNRFKCDVIGSGFIFHFRDARDIYIVTDDSMMLMARDLPEMLFVHRIYFVKDDGKRGGNWMATESTRRPNFTLRLNMRQRLRN